MKRQVLSTSAVALALSLATAMPLPVAAQGVAQLRDSVTASMAQIGMDPSAVDMLTLGQLAQVENVLSTTEDNTSKRNRIERIYAEAGMAGAAEQDAAQSGADATGGAMSGGAMSGGMTGMSNFEQSGGLEAIVRNDLNQIGMGDEVNVNALTVSQLAEIQNVLSSTDDNPVKRNRIEQIVAEQ